MAKLLSSLEIYYLVKELKVLEGSILEKVYEGALEDFLFIFHKSGKGKLMLRVILPGLIFLTDYKEEFPTLRRFAAWLRKELERARVKEVRQHEFERIVEINVETKEGKERTIIFELFSKGNIIVVDEINIILNAYKFEAWASREIKRGLAYKYPPAVKNPTKISKEEFTKIIKDNEKEIVKVVSKDLSLGKKYGNFVLESCEIDKQKLAKELSDEEVEKLFNEIMKLFSKEIKAFSCGDEIWPFEVNVKEQCKGFDSLSKAIEESFGKDIIEYKFSEKINKEKAALEKSLEKQRKVLSSLEREEKEAREAGEKLYLNYELVDNILKRARSYAEKNLGKEEMLRKLKEEFGDVVKDVNLKEKYVVIDI